MPNQASQSTEPLPTARAPLVSTFKRAGIAVAREAAGLTTEQLAKKLGLPDAQTLRDLESGAAPLTPDLLLALCYVLDVGIEALVTPLAGSPELRSAFEEGQHLERPLQKPFVQRLHWALDRGHLSARKAASLVGMTLGELGAVFPEHGMPSPFDL